MWILIIPIIVGLIILGLMFVFGGPYYGLIGILAYVLAVYMIRTIK